MLYGVPFYYYPYFWGQYSLCINLAWVELPHSLVRPLFYVSTPAEAIIKGNPDSLEPWLSCFICDHRHHHNQPPCPLPSVSRCPLGPLHAWHPCGVRSDADHLYLFPTDKLFLSGGEGRFGWSGCPSCYPFLAMPNLWFLLVSQYDVHLLLSFIFLASHVQFSLLLSFLWLHLLHLTVAINWALSLCRMFF